MRDVPNDQGGFVRLVWDGSPVDLAPLNQIESYWIWREAPASAITSHGTELAAGAFEAAGRPAIGSVRVTTNGATAHSWEFIDSQPAGHFRSYSFVAPTTSDSVAGSNPLTSFLVQARATDGRWWDTGPVSGYSVDNLPPEPPDNLVIEYSGTDVLLRWSPNGESDVEAYRLYRGGSSGFTPTSVNRIAVVETNRYTELAAPPSHYKVSAVDRHGNESSFASFDDAGTTGAPGGAGSLWLTAAPNPARETARFKFALPRAGAVTLILIDPAGRVVKRLVGGVLDAGAHDVRWDGLDARGVATSSGLYFARLEIAGAMREVRFVKLR